MATATVVLASVLFLGGFAAAHVVWTNGHVFFQPNNWPYYECARVQAGIGHGLPGGHADGKGSVYAYHHGCLNSNVRPTGWLAVKFDMFVLAPNGILYQCYAGSYALTQAWQSDLRIGGQMCNQWVDGTFYTTATGAYFYDTTGQWKFGGVTTQGHPL